MSSVTDPARSASGGRQPLAERTSATADQLRDWLRQMLLIREFEVRTMQAYQDKKRTEEEEAPTEPSEDIELLTDIRDLLRR